MDGKSVFRCELEITGTEHGEWQGAVHTDAGKQEFRSVSELLRLIHAEAGPPLNQWISR